LIRKLVTIIAAATITPAIADAIIAAATITPAIADAIATAVTAAIIAAAPVDTARRRNIDSAAGRRWRRNVDLAAAAPPIAAASIPVPDGTIATGEEATCFGPGRNGGGSECESCRGRDGYPAEFEHHDTSPVIAWR